MRKLYCFCIVSAFLSAAQSGHSLPPDCSLQETVVQAANHATEAEKLVLALPDAWRALYDPQREAFLSKTTTAAMKARLKELIAAYMHCASVDADPRQIERELSSFSNMLTFKVRRGPSGSYLIGINGGYQVGGGIDAVFAVFSSDQASWKEVFAWSCKPLDIAGGGPTAFDFVISPPNAVGQWLVGLKFIYPISGPQGAWINYWVMVPETRNANLPDPTVFSAADRIWLGGGDYGAISIDKDKFDVRFHGASIDPGVHDRTWVKDFSLRDDFRRIQPVALSPRDFVDEWISSDLVPSNMSSLRRDSGLSGARERARKGPVKYESAIKCTDQANHYQIALRVGDDDPLIYFQVIGDASSYWMKSAGESPEEDCSGPDILESMATR